MLKIGLRLTLATISILLTFFNVTVAHAGECTSISGTQCSVTCSQGSASLVCGKKTEICSASCSDANGNYDPEPFLQSLMENSDGGVSRWEAEDILNDVSRAARHGERRVFETDEFIIVIEPASNLPFDRW